MLNFDGPTDRLLSRQSERVSEILRCYAGCLIFIERDEVENNKPSILHEISNSLFDKVCLNASILFGDDSGKTCYLRLVDTDTNLTEKVILSVKIQPENNEKLLSEILLEFAGIDLPEFEKAKEFLRKYRNKHLAHADDYNPQTQEDRHSFPHLLPLAKLAFGLHKIILTVDRVEGDSYLEKNFSFNDIITYFKKIYKEELLSFCSSF